VPALHQRASASGTWPSMPALRAFAKPAGLRNWRVSGFENFLIFYLPRPDGVSIRANLACCAGLVGPPWDSMSIDWSPPHAPSFQVAQVLLDDNILYRLVKALPSRAGAFSSGWRPCKNAKV